MAACVAVDPRIVTGELRPAPPGWRALLRAAGIVTGGGQARTAASRGPGIWGPEVHEFIMMLPRPAAVPEPPRTVNRQEESP